MLNVTQITNRFIKLIIIVWLFLFCANIAGASNLNTRSVQLSTSQISANNVDYTVSFSTLTNLTIGSMVVKFCDNSPLVYDNCTVPPGFSASSITVPLLCLPLTLGRIAFMIELGRLSTPPKSTINSCRLFLE